VKEAQMSAQNLSAPFNVTDVSDASTNVSNTVSNQKHLVTWFDALMKLGGLLMAEDQMSKV